MSLRERLEEILPPDEILDRPIDLVAHAADASFYRLVPRAVVRPRDVADVQALFAFCRREKTPMTTLQLVYNKGNSSAVLRNFVRMVQSKTAELQSALTARQQRHR